jgi:hypothetical protein
MFMVYLEHLGFSFRLGPTGTPILSGNHCRLTLEMRQQLTVHREAIIAYLKTGQRNAT